MSELELVDINEEGKEEERGQENREEKDQEETSFSENTKDNYDNMRSRINSESADQSETRVDLNDFDLTDAARSIAKNQQDGKTRKEGVIQILRMIMDENLGDYGDSSEELINNISEAKISEKGKLTALKFKGKDVKVTAKGIVSKSATVQNREILRVIEENIKHWKENIKHWKDLEEKEQDPAMKLNYNTAKELCTAKKSLMEVRAGKRPESEEALSMIQEETNANDLTRFERFKKWAKENITGVSAVAISVAGVITAAVTAGRNAIKKGAKAVGQFGKALANIAKKAGPAIATILNILAQTLSWGAKALEFLSRNLWIVALFLTYLLYDTVKERVKQC